MEERKMIEHSELTIEFVLHRGHRFDVEHLANESDVAQQWESAEVLM